MAAVKPLSGMDASFLYFETPSTHMHVVGALLLDTSEAGGWSGQRVVQLLRQRLDLLPPFRRRLQGTALRLHHPVWVDVAHVDLAQHVDVVQCERPGSHAQLEAQVARFAEEKLDRSRPLFAIRVVEGLEGGRAAVLVKIHHSVVDGVAAARVLGHLFDLAPEGRTPEQLAEARALEAANDAPEPGLPRLVAHTAIGFATRPIALARLVPSAGKAVVNVVRSRQAQSAEPGVAAVPFTAPRAPFNGTISPRRAVSLGDVALADVKDVKNALGGTVNDVVIAVCGGAMRRYLEQRGELPESSLIAVVPVNVRDDSSSADAANVTSAMFTSLCTDVADPVERLRLVRQANAVGKADQRAAGSSIVTQAAEIAPPTLTTLMARLYTATRLADVHPVVHNVVISNVAGPPLQLYFAGARVDAVYPLGPVLDGPGLNITVASYRDRVGFGLIACGERMPDVAALGAQVAPALQELLDAARRA